MAEPYRKKLFQDNGYHICDPAADDMAAALRLKKIRDLLEVTEQGREALRFLDCRNIPVVFADRGGTARYCSRRCWVVDRLEMVKGSERVELSLDAADELLAGSLIHELRHARQAAKGVLYPDRLVSPADYIWHKRVMEADAEAEAVLRAFEIKQAGQDALFETRRDGVFGDMCKAAEAQYAKDPASLRDGRLKRAAFDAWFTSFGCQNRHFYDAEALSGGWETHEARFDLAKKKNGVGEALQLRDIEKIAMAGEEEVNYLMLPGFLPLDAPCYREGFAPGHQDRLFRLTERWKHKIGRANQPLHQRLFSRKQGR